MDLNRKIIFSSSLRQQPISGAFEGLWIRLKNLSYGTFLVLCVHNKIPILEWYRNSKKAVRHEPNYLQDLIDGKAVAIDFNTFAIFFDSELEIREPLKFMAENQKLRDAWISAINSVRVEHRNLHAGDEQPTTSTNNANNNYCRITPPPVEDPPLAQSSSPINCQSNSSDLELLSSGGLPGTSKSFSSISSASFLQNRESGIGLSTSNSDESNFRLSSKETATFSGCASSPSFSSTTSPFSFSQSRVRSSTMTHFQFPASQTDSNTAKSSILRNSTSSKENQTPNSPSVKRISTRKSCLNTPVKGISSPKPFSTIEKSGENKSTVTFLDSKSPSVEERDENNANEVANEKVYSDNYYHCNNVTTNGDYYGVPTSPNGNTDLKEPQRISLSISICTENLKIVRMENRFWIVGWEEQCHKAVSKLLHFGDEIVKVNENPTNFISDINTLFYASPVGVPIQLLIRSYPHGILKTLKKSIRISQKIGIVLHEGKNKIAAIESNTLASGKLPAEVPSYADPTQMIAPTITEINNKALNPFATNEQPYERIGEIANGTQFDVIIHPSDFVSLLKAQMKLSGYA